MIFFFYWNAVIKNVFYWAHNREHCGSQPPPNRLSLHRRWSAICSKVLELTSLHLDFCDSCLFVGGEISSFGENWIQSTPKGFLAIALIPIVISILSVMSPQLLLRQRGISLVRISVWRKKVYLRKEGKHTHTHVVLICKINLSMLAFVTLTGLWVFSPHCLQK